MKNSYANTETNRAERANGGIVSGRICNHQKDGEACGAPLEPLPDGAACPSCGARFTFFWTERQWDKQAAFFETVTGRPPAIRGGGE